MRQPTLDKARKLADTGAVTPIEDARAFIVRGEHSRYVVVLGTGVAHCGCPAHGGCSHIMAARIAAGVHA
jgi:hypothetical protein